MFTDSNINKWNKWGKRHWEFSSYTTSVPQWLHGWNSSYSDFFWQQVSVVLVLHQQQSADGSVILSVCVCDQTKCQLFAEHKVLVCRCRRVSLNCPAVGVGPRLTDGLIVALPAGCCQGYWAARWLKSGNSQPLFWGLQGHFLRGTDKALHSSWWELDKVCIRVCVRAF